MAFFWGYDEDGNKKYYDTTSNKVTMTPVYDESADVTTSSTLTINSLEDEMAYYGMTPEEIQAVMNKINGLDNAQSATKPITVTDPKTNETKTYTDGTLVSNSALSLKNTTLFQQSMVEIEKGKLSAMNLQNEIQKNQLDMMDYNLVMQSQLLGALNDLTTATKNQKLTTGTINVNPSVHIDTTAIAESTQTIADATVALSESATVQKEHYDFLKNGSETLKDSSNKVIKPREVEAKNNAENHIYKNAENTHDHQGAMLDVLNHLNNSGVGGGNGGGSDKDDLIGILNNLVSFNFEEWKREHNFAIFKENT